MRYIITIALCVLTLTITGCGLRVKSYDVQTRTGLASVGVMSELEYLRSLALDQKAVSGQPLMEADTDWLLTLSHRKGPNSTAEGSRFLHVSRVFKDAKLSQLPVTRHAQIYSFAVTLLHFSKTQPGVVWSGCLIMQTLNDKRAIPLIKPLLTAENPNLREFARKALDQLKSHT